MKTKRGKWIAFTLIIALSIGMVMPGTVMAKKRPNGLGASKQLKDIKNHWASNNIENLNMQGIIAGYPDGTFQPQAPVTHTEAVVMAVKLLGLDDQAAAKANAQLPFTDAAAAPSWAQGYVAVAVEQGLVPDSGQFQPMRKATRLYVTILLVKTLNAEVGIKTGTAQSDFTDTGSVSADDQEYISLAVLNDLIKGYGDGSFQPNKPVTRAELAAMFARLQDRTGSNPDQGRVVGTLQGVDASGDIITITTAVYLAIPGLTPTVNTETTYSYDLVVDANAAIYRDNRTAALADMKSGDKVTLLLNKDNAVIYLDAHSTSHNNTVVKGKVVSVDAANLKISISQNGVKTSYHVAQNAAITRNGATVALDEIATGDQVTMQKDSTGTIVKIVARSNSQNNNAFEEIKIDIRGPGFKIKMVRGQDEESMVEVRYIGTAAQGVQDLGSSVALQIGVKKEDHGKHLGYAWGHWKNGKKNGENRTGDSYGEVRIKLTSTAASDYIDKFITDAKLASGYNPDQIIAAVENILGFSVGKNNVSINIKTSDESGDDD